MTIGLFILAPMLVAAPQQQGVITRETIRNLDCTLKMTNDHVSDTIMMQDVTRSPDACRKSCEDFSESSLLSMREAVKVLRYRCEYRGRVVAEVDLKR